MINAMGTPACTFKQLWDNVAAAQAAAQIRAANELRISEIAPNSE